MLTNNLTTPDINRWWETKRWEYNKGLLISGPFTLVLTWISIALEKNSLMNISTTLLIAFVFVLSYGIYIVAANIFYILGRLVDTAFKTNNNNLRHILFTCGYWFSALALPVLLFINIAMFIISIPDHTYLLPTQ